MHLDTVRGVIMKGLLAFVLVMHGLIHLMGFAKAFKLAEINQLREPISTPLGLLWLLAAILFVTATVLLFMEPNPWWIVSSVAVVLSQFLIFTSWRDAKFGTIANIIIAIPVVIAFAGNSASSYRARFDREVEDGTVRLVQAGLVTEADLAHLPVAVQKYLKYVGVIGRSRVRNFRLAFRGQIRNGATAPWMKFTAEQFSSVDKPMRAFHIESSMYGIPFGGLHLYVGSSATMQVKLASLISVVDARGPEMNQSETVTTFNDMCLLAPATLIDQDIHWQQIDSESVKAWFTNAGNTIEATLLFGDDGALINFISKDRYQSNDGNTFRNYPWSTPVHEYREFDGLRIASVADAVWHPPEGEFAYGRFTLTKVEYNIGMH